ncbi:MAG: hypothetical protein ACI4QR_02420 [Eubacteriales bacterium]
MEISRKKIADADIYAKEKALYDEINDVIADFSEKFSELGFELDTEFSRDNDEINEEKAEELRKTNIASDIGEYEYGYISGVKITVKRPKTVEELEKEAAEEEEYKSAEEALALEESENEDEEEINEQKKNDITLERANRELNRSIAFTSMFLVRVYKTFWHETVSISDGTDEIKADLTEFLEKLSENEN